MFREALSVVAVAVCVCVYVSSLSIKFPRSDGYLTHARTPACMKRIYRDKKASVHRSEARNKERSPSRG